MLVATATEEPQEPRKNVVIQRVADVARTGNQVGILLRICESNGNLLAVHNDVGTTTDLDKEAVESARSTFLLAQQRLRDIVDESARWQIHDNLEQHIEAIQRAARETEEIRRDLAASLSKPHRTLGAHLAQFVQNDTGRSVWVAWIGNVPRPDGLCGEGLSPAEALDAFDQAYLKRLELAPPPPSVSTESQRPPDEPPAPKTKRKPRSKK